MYVQNPKLFVYCVLALFFPILGCHDTIAPEPPEAQQTPAPKPETADTQESPRPKLTIPLPPFLETAPKAVTRKSPPNEQSLQRITKQAVVPSKLYVQVDRPLYRPGETIWFRIWQLDLHQKLSKAKKNSGFRVMLKNPRGAIVAQKSIENKAGKQHNDFVLSQDSMGGLYSLVVMDSLGVQVTRPILIADYQEPQVRKKMEFLRDGYGPGDEIEAVVSMEGAERLAEYPLTVQAQVDGQSLPVQQIKTDSKGEALVKLKLPKTIRSSDGVLTVMVQYGGIRESISRSIPILLDKIRVQFFPEGGDLVDNLSSRVYFEAVDENGKPADIAGHVIDSKGQEVTPIRSVHDGFGRFTLTPKAGESYHVKLVEPTGITTKYPLPTAQTEGCVLHSYDDFHSKEKDIRVGLHCTQQQETIMVASQHGQVLDTATFETGPDGAAVYLQDKKQLQGLVRVTAYTSSMEPLAERLIYRNWGRNLNITISTDKNKYGPRDKVKLSIQTLDWKKKPIAAELALSVVDDSLLRYADDKEKNLLATMYLSELQGKIEEANWYFDTAQKEAPYGADLLAGTRGWRRFARQEVRPASHSALRSNQAPGQPAPKGTEKEQRNQDKKIIDLINPQLLQGLQLDANQNLIGTGGLGLGGQGLGGGGAVDGLGGLDNKGAEQAVGIGGLIGRKGGGQGGLGFGANQPTGFQGGRSLGAGRYRKTTKNRSFVRLQKPQVIGDLDKDLIKKVIRRNMSQLRYCYYREQVKLPLLRGRVMVHFVIDKTGRVNRVNIKKSTLNNKRVESCVTSRFKRFRFPKPEQGIVIVRYPMIFSYHPTGDAGESIWAKVRTFPKPVYDNKTPKVRSDFRSTVFWEPVVKTNKKGKASLSFHLSDAITTFTVQAEGVGAALLGNGKQQLQTELPFDMTLRIPQEIGLSDSLLLPITLNNNRNKAVTVDLQKNIGELLTINKDLPAAITLPAKTRKSFFYGVQAGQKQGEIPVELIASAAGLSDQRNNKIKVVSNDYPDSWSMAGALGKRVRHKVPSSKALKGTLRAELEINPNPLSSMLSSITGMLREPTGCFEQTSSANYPNLMVLRYLKEFSIHDPDLLANARGKLKKGYTRLTSFEAKGGGFEWFGREPGHESLTAYGLQQFVDMAPYHPVDQRLISRTTNWLYAKRDGKGGYQKKNSNKIDRFGRANPHVRNSYVTYSLVRSRTKLALKTELDAQQRWIDSSDDPYTLALATLSMFESGRQSAALKGVAKLTKLQGSDGSWDAKLGTITNSGKRDRQVEATALAILSLLQDKQRNPAVFQAMHWLAKQKRGSVWGSTQATVLALKAVFAYHHVYRQTAADGTIEVLVDGKSIAKASYSTQQAQAIRITGLEDHLQEGSQIELQNSRDSTNNPISYSIIGRYRTESPKTVKDAPLHIATNLNKTTLVMGETTRMEVTGTAKRTVYSPIIKVGIPAGLATQPWQLKELKEKNKIAAFETGPRWVIFYMDVMQQGSTYQLDLDLVAEIPGSYTSPASTAYPYYSNQAKSWSKRQTVQINPS